MWAQVINRFMGLIGLRISRARSRASGSLEFEDVFFRLKSLDVPVATVIDVGASTGRWSRKVMRYYPRARYHLLEANPVHLPGLKAFTKRYRNGTFSVAAAADEVGEVYFDASSPWDGAASHSATGNGQRRVPCTTVDAEVERLQLSGPFLLKLDTHGFEVPILRGAAETMKQASVLILETYNFHLRSDSLTFWEMCSYLHEQGFRPIDLLEPMHRRLDGAFWQVDIVFVRNDRPEFEHANYA